MEGAATPQLNPASDGDKPVRMGSQANPYIARQTKRPGRRASADRATNQNMKDTNNMVTRCSSTVKVQKSLTAAQAATLRTAIYAKFPQLAGNVQIVTSCGVVLVTGVRGFAIDPAIADRLHCFVADFDTTPSTEATVALDAYLSMVAVSGYKAPSKRSRSIRRMGA